MPHNAENPNQEGSFFEKLGRRYVNGLVAMEKTSRGKDITKSEFRNLILLAITSLSLSVVLPWMNKVLNEEERQQAITNKENARIYPSVGPFNLVNFSQSIQTPQEYDSLGARLNYSPGIVDIIVPIALTPPDSDNTYNFNDEARRKNNTYLVADDASKILFGYTSLVGDATKVLVLAANKLDTISTLEGEIVSRSYLEIVSVNVGKMPMIDTSVGPIPDSSVAPANIPIISDSGEWFIPFERVLTKDLARNQTSPTDQINRKLRVVTAQLTLPDKDESGNYNSSLVDIVVSNPTNVYRVEPL